ncbi:actin-related protein 2/3 complex subunit 1a [Quercus suber]|uniref:Arp2/3 complex 41 kDa subunit n=1 Tax=Quercus suber TaxID=58331 RepID=A0AAW0JJV1_QUESU
MTAIAVNQFAQSITCHAWGPDDSMVAFCPNNNEVHIYRLSQDKWEKVHVLEKHDQIVSGIDWSPRSNRIVTASHDRNSHMYQENKFAVGSGAKTVCICYYEQENNWWVSKLIRKRHDSSVTSVAWHPNNILLATTSADGKCRIFSTFIKGVDTKDSRTGPSSDSKFGEQIVQLDLSFSWAFGVKWSPSGDTLAYVGHNSMIYFVDEIGPSPLAQNVAFRDLPLRDLSDMCAFWICRSFIRFLGERKTISSGSKYGSQFSEAFGKLYGQSKHGLSNDAVEPSRSRGGIHDNCINCILPLRQSGISTVMRFSTSGLDGKVVIWDLENQADLSEYL